MLKSVYIFDMAHSIRISDDLHAMAYNSGQTLHRSVAQQMEYWARLGAALDAAGISAATVKRLLGNGESADALVVNALDHDVETDGGLVMLTDVQRKDERDVAEGRRAARSLMAVQKGYLEGYTFTPNPNSEFDGPGEGW